MSSLARVYASVLYHMAKKDDTWSSWFSFLEDLIHIASFDDIRWLATTVCSLDKKEQVLVACLQKSITKPQRAFIRLVLERKRLGCLSGILKFFRQMYLAHISVCDVRVETAMPLSKSQEDTIAQLLEQKLSSRVSLSIQKAPQLIAGVRIYIGDDVIDASARGYIAQLSCLLI